MPSHRTIQRLGTIVALALVVLASSVAWATVAKYMDLSALVERSDAIAHGVVVGQASFLDEERDLVLTRTTLQIDRSYMGETSPIIQIQQIGGEFGDRVTKITGDASFTPGEEVIVFMKSGGGDLYYLTSMAQAKYGVTREGGAIKVTRDISEIAFIKGHRDIEHLEPEQRDGGDFIAELGALIAGIKGVEKTLELPARALEVKR